jgi:hypothetical protein
MFGLVHGTEVVRDQPDEPERRPKRLQVLRAAEGTKPVARSSWA